MEKQNERLKPPPSILSQVEAVIDEQAVDSVTAGVLLKKGEVGAEVKAQKDIGKPGGWTIGATARITNKDTFAALLAKWTPKD